jgi:hypothetical protein
MSGKPESARSSSDEKLDLKDVEAPRVDFLGADDEQLEHLGYKPEFKRDYSFLGLFSLSMSELAVFPGVAGTIWWAHSCMQAIVYAHLMVDRYSMGYVGLIGMTWGWLVGALMGQVRASRFFGGR